MIVGIPKEIGPSEKRVAATPETVKKLALAGLDVRVQAGAGTEAFISDADYRTAGAKIAADAKGLFSDSDVVLKVAKPEPSEIELMKSGVYLISFLQPLINGDLVEKLAVAGVNSLAIDAIPRIARAQRLDALSSQSNIAGYKAVLMAADTVGRMMPLMMTAAGTVSAAKVLILGAGVAGLQAVATAKRLGAIVEVFDVRPAVKEQVESLGAKFVELEVQGDGAEDKGGYAKQLSADDHAREQKLIGEHVHISDIVITTALIPGKKAPILITKEMVDSMKHGAVIVDLAAEGGGNCELTELGKNVVCGGVTIMGPENVPSRIAAQSSQLYARNVMNLLLDIVKDGKVTIDLADEIIKGALITHEGKVIHEATLRVIQKEGAK
ncbi:MAG: Re/Si-specific NAD(P)(+) transhydrogenase subunit alpha [Candidatus Omnitrophota bacterium]|nr:Re/Si-specific NAD(P)(+) transhydrogenase subunit alpha [Candidatus Omnitrophota bacterium]